MDDEKTLGEYNYDDFAERYANHVDDNLNNAHYERLATLSLLPPKLGGLRVLEGACGPGFYTETLVRAGAVVTAFDVTEAFVRMTRERVGDGAQVLRADLQKPFDFVQMGSFDLALCALALEYVADLPAVMRSFKQALKPGGLFIFSIGHPANKVPDLLGNHPYLEEGLVETVWKSFGEPHVQIAHYHRPLSAVLNAVAESGFCLQRTLEPKPDAEFARRDPEHYVRHMAGIPYFICFRTQKVSETG